MLTSKILGGSFEPLEPPHPTGLINDNPQACVEYEKVDSYKGAYSEHSELSIIMPWANRLSGKILLLKTIAKYR